MMQFIEPTFNRPDIIARDGKTGAYLGKSRAQYYLVIPGENTRHWSRRRIASDDVALAKANALLRYQQEARP